MQEETTKWKRRCSRLHTKLKKNLKDGGDDSWLAREHQMEQSLLQIAHVYDKNRTQMNLVMDEHGLV